MSVISSIQQVIGSDKTRVGAFLAELDPDDDTPIQGSIRQFQYFPETVNDSRGVEYQVKNIVGSSHPIYQWVHGSERRITFEAVFSSDYSTLSPEGELSSGNFLAAAETVSAFVKNPVASVVATGKKLFAKDSDNGEVDVSGAVAWLRSKTYPLYRPNQPVDPPPKLLLWLENSGITSFVGGYKVDVIPVLLTRCDVTFEGFFRNGRPRVATVGLDFVETIQVGSTWKYVSRADIETVWNQSGSNLGYTIGAGKSNPRGNDSTVQGKPILSGGPEGDIANALSKATGGIL